MSQIDGASPDRAGPRTRPTMRDVAALARVSLKTVSRVINGESTVDPELAARVHRAATTLDYRPNLTARSLRSSDGRTRTIGVVLENVGNPFSSALHRAVEDIARSRGVAVFAGSVDEDPRRERDIALALIARRVDGLIIVPAGDDQSYLANEQRAGLSLVFADRPPRLLRADTVISDNTAGAQAAVRHLIAAGHRRIGFLGDLKQIATAAERVAGYVQALSDSGIEFDEDLVRLDLHGIDAARAAARSLMATARPSALFTTQNLITIGAIRALRDLDLHERIALVGFDDFLLADMLQPAVTVIAQEPATIGAKACEVLFQRMDGDTSPTQTHTIPTRLIARGSGEIPPTRPTAPRSPRKANPGRVKSSGSDHRRATARQAKDRDAR
ncbi:MAG TPA: LacI family DNA-binding transcriptional regulator [Solirubrobacteraceae bacterium]|nr:LacI family DNA-binding transcriptional regulator [Solirubrobacteraceae bacterium]